MYNPCDWCYLKLSLISSYHAGAIFITVRIIVFYLKWPACHFASFHITGCHKITDQIVPYISYLKNSIKQSLSLQATVISIFVVLFQVPLLPTVNHKHFVLPMCLTIGSVAEWLKTTSTILYDAICWTQITMNRNRLWILEGNISNFVVIDVVAVGLASLAARLSAVNLIMKLGLRLYAEPTFEGVMWLSCVEITIRVWS